MELARTTEEHARTAVNTLRRHLSPETVRKIEQAIREEAESSHRSPNNSRHA